MAPSDSSGTHNALRFNMASMSDATSPAALGTVENFTEMDDIQKAYDALCKEEESVNKELNVLLEQQASLESKMTSLHKMLPNLQILETDSRQLSSMIRFTSDLADNVSGKVRKLDVAKSRVTDCITRVQDIMDLKHCTDGVKTALQNEDYEKAAGHIHRFRSLDEGVIRMTADASEGSTLDVSFQLLSDSEVKLQKIVEAKFDEAVRVADAASVERFFKIFPLLGLHDKGLLKFGKYLSAKLSQTMDHHLEEALHREADDKRASVIFADAITLLFEEIARIVEIHQPLVETYYGPGRLFMLLQGLQKECDRQARRIIENFKSRRQYEQKVKLVRQSLMIHKPQSGEKVDPRDLDLLLSEVVLIHARAELYLRFFHRRVVGDFEIASQDEETQTARVVEVEKFLAGCELSREMQELIGSYIMMEEYFMREMISKAVQMDAMEEGVHTSSMVDDAFFIVKKSVRRAVSSDSVDGVCAMLNLACGIIEGDFREVLFSRLRAGFPSGFDLQQAYNLVQSSLQQGKLATTDLEKEKAKALFLTTLNNAEVSCQYCKTLKTNLEVEVLKIQRISEQGKAKLESCLSELGGTSTRFRDVVEFGFSQLVSSAIKPRLKPLVESFLTTSHNISEEEFSNYEANDPWVQNCIVSLDSMLSSFKAALTPANYDHFVNLLASEMTQQLEKTVFKTTFNRLGGLQFDKELRALVGYLSSVTTWTIRDKFARLTQMATILNLERVSEILDYWGQNSGPLTWRLTPTEVRQVLALRMDFRGEDIKRLKL